MDSTHKPILLLLLILYSLYSIRALSDEHNAFVYKKCTNQTSNVSTNSHSQTLLSFFGEIIKHSSKSKFFKTTKSYNDVSISGLFQCRGDLTNRECHTCINKLPDEVLSNGSCSEAVSGQVQLRGCYVRYQTGEYFRRDVDDDKRSKHELLHKSCGKEKAVALEFEETRNAAFAAMEIGVEIDHGFYKGNYGLVHVIAQCEGDLMGCDCGECVNNAVQIAVEECGESVSGEVYLDKCFVGYSYDPHGLPGDSYPGERRERNHNDRGKK